MRMAPAVATPRESVLPVVGTVTLVWGSAERVSYSPWPSFPRTITRGLWNLTLSVLAPPRGEVR